MLRGSVIVCSHNRRAPLQRCLEHVVEQVNTVDDVEIIVVDNASTDGTAEMVRAWERRVDRFRSARHPSVGLLRASYPSDIIWRAVLEQDDATLSAIDLTEAPLWLMVQRLATGVEVTRMSEPAWHFLAELCAGRALQDAIDAVPDIDAPAFLAEHLAAGRFIGFSVTDAAAVVHPLESSHD